MLVTQGREHHEKIMQTGEQIEVEEVYPQPDGSAEYFQAIKSPVLDATGRIVGSQGILFDITGRKLAEEELQHVNRALKTTSNCNMALVYSTTESALLTKFAGSSWKTAATNSPGLALRKTTNKKASAARPARARMRAILND